MKFSDAEASSFNTYARDPETWLFAARRAMAVARYLNQRFEELRSVRLSDISERSGCFYASYFHAGVAIENSAKAVLISRDPTIVSKGILDKSKFGGPTGHALLDPVESIVGSINADERRLLTKLEQFVWMGRYSIPTTAGALENSKLDLARMSVEGEFEDIAALMERIVACVPREGHAA